jgi:FlaA1/EpsC-like NDP-sugar epimerase
MIVMFKQLQHLAGRYAGLILVDALSIILAFYLALALRFTGQSYLTYVYLPQFRGYILAIALVYCVFNGFFGLYSRLWRYASAQEMVSIIESVALSTLLVAVFDLLRPERPLPLSVVLVGGSFSLAAFAASRYRSRLIAGFLWRWRSTARTSSSSATRVLIVGAGEAGQLLAWRLQTQEEGSRYHIVGLVDDDPAKQGMRVHGRKVLGGRQAIADIVQQERVELVVIAIHTISGQDFRDILSLCQSTAARVKTLPDVFQSLAGLSDAALLRDVTIEDLLGRQPASVDYRACHALLAGEVVMVSGAAGSIGSELCRQIVQFGPRLLLMLDNNETGLYDLSIELQTVLRAQGPDADVTSPRLCYLVADVTQRNKMEEVFRQHRPQIILHAAAYKHVPLMEEYPEEAIRVNVGGTRVVLELASTYGAKRFVFVSTDKAVNPLSVMGSTKRLGEMLVTASVSDGPLVACAVRFGNVLGSRGSVVPTFWRQIDMGGPLTITHPEATRFFMSISEASSLILQAACLAQSGEVFMLEMGEQIRILDLAQRMIRLRGLRVGQDIPIAYTKLRPGEKLHEQLLADCEEKVPTSHSKVFRICDNRRLDRSTFLSAVHELLQRAEQDVSSVELRQLLFAITNGPLSARSGS